MQQIRWHAPSRAMVVAMLALFVALGGSGYAATQSQKNGSDAGAAKKKKPPRGIRGPKGASGPRGLQGVPGQDGTALGYARVNADGTVNPALSKGVTSANVTKLAGAGNYCFSGLRFTPNSLAANLSFVGTPFSATVFVAMAAEPGFASSTGCPAGTQAMVGTQNAGNQTAEPFFVIFT